MLTQTVDRIDFPGGLAVLSAHCNASRRLDGAHLAGTEIDMKLIGLAVLLTTFALSPALAEGTCHCRAIGKDGRPLAGRRKRWNWSDGLRRWSKGKRRHEGNRATVAKPEQTNTAGHGSTPGRNSVRPHSRLSPGNLPTAGAEERSARWFDTWRLLCS